MSTDDDNKKPERPITKDSLISMTLAGSVVGIAALPAWNVSAALTSNTLEMQTIKSTIQDVKLQLARAAESRWHRYDMRAWVQLLQAQNPSLKIPTVE